MRKKKWKFFFKMLALVAFIILVSSWIVFNNVLKLNHEKKFASLIEGSPTAKSLTLNSELGVIHYVTSGDDESKLPILLIHGSPGSWDAWMPFLQDSILLEKYFVISVDRPGFGKTKIAFQEDLKNQAIAVAPILDRYPGSFILVGHSYGAAVIQQLALDHPDKVSNLIYVAGTLEPEAQRPRWYNKVADTKIVSMLLSEVWNASSKEMIGLYSGLKENETKLKDLHVPTYFIQGTKDVLVPFSAIEYYKKHGPKNGVEYIILENENHFIPFTKPHLIMDILYKL